MQQNGRPPVRDLHARQASAALVHVACSRCTRRKLRRERERLDLSIKFFSSCQIVFEQRDVLAKHADLLRQVFMMSSRHGVYSGVMGAMPSSSDPNFSHNERRSSGEANAAFEPGRPFAGCSVQ